MVVKGRVKGLLGKLGKKRGERRIARLPYGGYTTTNL